MRTNHPTIQDVADLASVSKSTVSAVLNGNGSVGEETRQRVLAAVEQLNFHPRGPAMRRSEGHKRRSIGLVIKEIDNPYYTEIAAGALAEARTHGYTVLVVSSEGEYEAEKEAVQLMFEKGIDGLLLTPVLNDDTDLSHLFDLKRRNYPFVLLEEIQGIRASLIDVENVGASQHAVEYLIEQGHTRIVHFAGPDYSMHTRERIDGVRRAFSRSRLSFLEEEAVVPAGAHLEDGYRAGLEYFRGRSPAERPTAVTCYNDLVALGLLRALRELGIAVPDEVSVIGYDDLEILRYLPVPLSSVHVPKFEMGKRAAQLLIRQIEARESIPPTKEYLEVELVERYSTRARPPGDVEEVRGGAHAS